MRTEKLSFALSDFTILKAEPVTVIFSSFAILFAKTNEIIKSPKIIIKQE